MSHRVILIDDERALRESVAQWLCLADCEVQAFARAREALHELDIGFEGVIVSDLKMPDMDGMQLLEAAHAIDADIPVVLITGHGDVTSAVAALKQGAYDFIEKPFQPERLMATLNRAAEARQLQLQNRLLRQGLQGQWALHERLLGECDAMRQLRDQLVEFASVEVNLLLVGETGTGKEVMARSLHALGARNQGPFQAIDCGALPADHVEQSLFGEHGADERRSPFLSADGGTLLLDEVLNLPLAHQVRLLRVLEERELAEVGSNEVLPFDIRLISAANTDLPEAVEQGRFRRDLYFRLNTVELLLPPLRERGDDIVLLFEHFLRNAAQAWQREAPRPSSADVATLFQHRWPGNVRELKNMAERFVLFHGQPLRELLERQSDTGRATLAEQVQHYERSLIEHALRESAGDMAAAAERLKTPRRTLNDKLQRHEIDRGRFTE